MPIRITLFSDDEDNQMGCFINEENKLMIIIGDGSQQSQHYIKLDKEEIPEVISALRELYEAG